MAIFRVNKNKNYTVMSNYHLKDMNMSFKAKGLLSMMLSLPDDWDYSITGLSKISKENEKAIKIILNELKELGYLRIVKMMPNETKSGRIEYIYDIYEMSAYKKQEYQKQGVEFQEVEKQDVEKQEVEKQEVEKGGQINTNIQNTNIQNTKKQNTKKQNTNDILSCEVLKIGENNDKVKTEIYKEIIDYLNNRTKSNYKYTSKATQVKINARLNEGYSLNDFIVVIDKKCDEWLNTDFEQYLCPETLFGTKFEKYLNQKVIKTKRTLKDISMAEIDMAIELERGGKEKYDEDGIF